VFFPPDILLLCFFSIFITLKRSFLSSSFLQKLYNAGGGCLSDLRCPDVSFPISIHLHKPTWSEGPAMDNNTQLSIKNVISKLRASHRSDRSLSLSVCCLMKVGTGSTKACHHAVRGVRVCVTVYSWNQKRLRDFIKNNA